MLAMDADVVCRCQVRFPDIDMGSSAIPSIPTLGFRRREHSRQRRIRRIPGDSLGRIESSANDGIFRSTDPSRASCPPEKAPRCPVVSGRLVGWLLAQLHESRCGGSYGERGISCLMPLLGYCNSSELVINCICSANVSFASVHIILLRGFIFRDNRVSPDWHEAHLQTLSFDDITCISFNVRHYIID